MSGTAAEAGRELLAPTVMLITGAGSPCTVVVFVGTVI